ncbi:hypothetical protein CHU92_08200 [Flavobacterium cyanobacteriorum]|uniref:Outer membrane chaperone Skp n=1 Tax=Flavobacterium cyanobacteriorum TaxID=2022802 RepID=A0A255Z7M8_9FLAO|nr:OmpH family outer membrane protein [Flavobacterium cyanobacteriorum]OYQ37449.1 hypothetical protein CHU92_08200 [Flavobacterium cyanobacteriorum]
MKKHFLLLLSLLSAIAVSGQSRGIKIAYIDMEYILEKVPDYAEAKNQLELKAQKWKQEIETKKNDINKLKESLKAERVLLTKELIQEREDEIQFQEKELLDYQEKKFGSKGDLITQKAVLVKPIQDQVFTAVQDISEAKKYDFVFDKSSDLTMLFAAKRHDISDQVIRRLTRAAKREQLSNKELKKLEEQEAKEDLADDPEFADRKKALDDKKAARQKLIEDRRAAQKAKREEAIARREQLKQEREAKINGTAAPKANTKADKENPDSVDSSDTEDLPVNNSKPGATGTSADAKETAKQNAAERQKAAQELKAQKAAERKAALEEKKKKQQAEREAAKKAREEKTNKPAENSQENKNKN